MDTRIYKYIHEYYGYEFFNIRALEMNIHGYRRYLGGSLP